MSRGRVLRTGSRAGPQGLDGLFVSPAKGFVAAAVIIAIVFICGGAFNVIQKTGAITAVIHNLSLDFGRKQGPAPPVHPGDHDHLLPGRRHLGHVRGDHALHPHLRPSGPVARLRHHRRRGPALRRRGGRIRRGLLQSVHGRHRPGHRRAASLFGPRLPAHRLGGRDGHRHRRGHALRRPGPQGPDDQPDLRGRPGEEAEAQRRQARASRRSPSAAPTSGSCSSSRPASPS
ncbi:MAG: hypothetical protein MZV64_52845 [Ignavibacteriales bacterium]|nr:hypothetical protein [Ignavibacteriales bacterium]